MVVTVVVDFLQCHKQWESVRSILPSTVCALCAPCCVVNAVVVDGAWWLLLLLLAAVLTNVVIVAVSGC